MNVDLTIVIIAILALAAGLLVGALLANRKAGSLAADLAVAQSKVADAELVACARDAVERERNEAMRDLAALRAQSEDRAATLDTLRDELATIRADRDAARTALASTGAQVEAFEARLLDMRDAKEQMAAQFNDLANKALTDAQKAFLDRAEARFRQGRGRAPRRLRRSQRPDRTDAARSGTRLG
jgi:DNA recombination protein RmuC